MTAAKEPTWAVLLVHGVGDTGPGRTLEAVLPTLRETNHGLVESDQPETVMLPEPRPRLPHQNPVPPQPPDRTSDVPIRERFPVHVRRFSVTNGRSGDPARATFAEVFWADLSTAGEGTLRLLLRIFTAIFDLRYIPYVAAACEKPYLARWLRLVLYLLSSLLCGPIAGVTAFMGFLLASRWGISQLPHRLRAFVEFGPVGLAIVGLVVSIGLLLLHRRLKWRGHWLWVIAWIAVAAVADAIAAWGSRYSFSDNLSALLLVLGALFLAVGAFTIIGFLTWLLARIESRVKKSVHSGPALDAALAATFLQLGLWLIVVAIVGGALLRTWAPDIWSGQDPVFDETFRSFAQNLALAFVVAGCGLFVWIARRRWVRHHREPYSPATARTIPRLLVNDAIVAAIFGTTLAGTLATFVALLTGTDRFDGFLRGDFYRRLVTGGIFFIVTVGGLFLRKGLNNALHILMDIVNHFYREKLPPPPISEVPKPDVTVFTVQQRLEARFRAVLDHVLETENVKRLTVVAHSQGTMIAIDVLWLGWAANRLKGIDVDLVTMGSPFTHLYQYYFPDRYPALFKGSTLSPAWGSHLRTTVKRWMNIYRVDDFVGTNVDGDSAGDFPQNICIAAGGHTGYWSQPAALQAMSDLLPGR